MCVSAMTTERTRPLVCYIVAVIVIYRRYASTHTHGGAYFSLCTAQSICICVCVCEYGHVRVLDDIIIIMWPIRYFVIFFFYQHRPYTCVPI